MGAEVTAFKAKLYALLQSISGLTAVVGTRISYVWPAGAVVYPHCAFNVARRASASDIGAPVWDATIEVYLFSGNDDELDTIDDAIVDYVIQNSEAILPSLSTADIVSCMSFIYLESTQSPHDIIYTEDDTLVFVRTLRFSSTFVKSDSYYAS